MKKSKFIDFIEEDERNQFSINFLLMNHEDSKMLESNSFIKKKSFSENNNDENYFINKYHKPISKII